uniref:ribosomal protein S3 n=1 Tax=Pilophorus fibula TaxID=2840247 RepID=UPI0022FD515C|nr:ribosomal protein S3 [Pilophorus fibula]WBP64270.1 ribosomal protein S3 [Pilophorus fibula]
MNNDIVDNMKQTNNNDNNRKSGVSRVNNKSGKFLFENKDKKVANLNKDNIDKTQRGVLQPDLGFCNNTKLLKRKLNNNKYFNDSAGLVRNIDKKPHIADTAVVAIAAAAQTKANAKYAPINKYIITNNIITNDITHAHMNNYKQTHHTDVKANNYIYKPRHYTPFINEWYNSIYTFNMNMLKVLPSLNKTLFKLIKSYFNLYSWKLEKRTKSRRLRIKARRLSTNRILASKPELKHTSDQINITIYTYNRQKKYYLNKLKKITSLDVMDNVLPNYLKKILLQPSSGAWPSNLKLNKIKNKGLHMLMLYTKIFEQKKSITVNNHANNQEIAAEISTYLDKSVSLIADNTYNRATMTYYFFKYYAVKSLREEMLSVYIKQLIYFNQSKFDQRFIQPLIDQVKKIYNKNIQINLVDLKYLYLNSFVFSETLLTKLKNRNNNIIKVLDKSLSMFTVPDMNKLAVYNDIYNRSKRLQNITVKNFTKDKHLKLTISNNQKLELYSTNKLQDFIASTKQININGSIEMPSNKASLASEAMKAITNMNGNTSKIVTEANIKLPKHKDGVDLLLSTVHTNSVNEFKNYKTFKWASGENHLCNEVFYSINPYSTLMAPLSKLEQDNYVRNRQINVLKTIKNVDVTGIRIEVAGRLSRRTTSGKSIFKLRYKGNIKDMNSSYKGLSSVTLRGFAKSNLQHTKVTSCSRIGSYGVKVWISSFWSSSPYWLLCIHICNI